MDSFYNNRFDSIQTLRAIAALSVICSHISFMSFGAFGAEIFFCISGFVMMFSTEKSTEKYWRKRLVRVLPLYYLMTFVTFALLVLFPAMFTATTADGGQLVKSLLFVPFDVGGGVVAPILKVGWTIYYEVFFYLVLYISLKINFRLRGIICVGFLVILVGISTLTNATNLFLVFYGSPLALEFGLGILIYYIFRKIYHLKEENKLPPYTGTVSLIIAAAVYIYLWATGGGFVETDLMRFLTWGLPAMVLVISLLTAGLWFKMPKAMVKLGDISFSLYLIHYYPIMFLDRKLFDFSVATPLSVAGAILGVAVCIVAAYISYLLIEKKLPKLILK